MELFRGAVRNVLLYHIHTSELAASTSEGIRLWVCEVRSKIKSTSIHHCLKKAICDSPSVSFLLPHVILQFSPDLLKPWAPTILIAHNAFVYCSVNIYSVYNTQLKPGTPYLPLPSLRSKWKLHIQWLHTSKKILRTICHTYVCLCHNLAFFKYKLLSRLGFFHLYISQFWNNKQYIVNIELNLLNSFTYSQMNGGNCYLLTEALWDYRLLK